MPGGISDTHPAAAHVQFALLRAAGMLRRVELATEMTRFAIDAAYRALRCRHPDASDVELGLLFAEQQYGVALAARLRAVLIPQAGADDLIS